MGAAERMMLLRGHEAVPAERLGVGYIRVSKVGDRGDELISPELQRHSIQTWADANGVRIVKWIEELDRSGREFAKRKVAEIVEDIAASTYRFVVLWKWSRWGRNMRESQLYLGMAEAVGGEVRAATEDFDPNTTMGRFTRDQMLLVAQLQSDMMSDGWKDVHAKRRRDGLPHNGQKRWGYQVVGKKYVPDSDFAPILASAYEQYVAGKSMTALAREWNTAGLRSVQGRLFSDTTMGGMLDTGFAAGLIREKNNKSRSGRGKTSLLSWDVWRQGDHQPVISMELWDAYVSRRLAQAKMPPRVRTAQYGLSAMLRCGVEGCTSSMTVRHTVAYTKQKGKLVRVPDAPRRINWACREAKMLKTHAPNYISNDIAEQMVLAWLVEQATPGDGVTEEARRLDAARKVKGEVESAGALVEQFKAERRKLLKLHMAGAVEEEDYLAEKAEIDKRVDAAIIEMEGAKARQEKIGPDMVRNFGALAEEWPTLAHADRREALSTVVQHFLVLPREVGDRRLRAVPLWEKAAG